MTPPVFVSETVQLGVVPVVSPYAHTPSGPAPTSAAVTLPWGKVAYQDSPS
jgi:hypothetical protein